MRAIILDDESLSAEYLFLLLKRHCPEISVTGIETDPEVALAKIKHLKPDLLFLDIELQTSNVFDVIKELNGQQGVILTTAYDKFEYAQKAVRIDAIDYLMKPIEAVELVKAVEKAKFRLKPTSYYSSAEPPVHLGKVSVPTKNGFIFLQLESIVRFEAENSYTTAFIEGGSQLVISKNLGEIEKIVEHSTFFRVHKSHLINRLHLKQYLKGEGGEVILSNNDRVPVSRDRRDDFLKSIKGQ